MTIRLQTWTMPPSPAKGPATYSPCLRDPERKQAASALDRYRWHGHPTCPRHCRAITRAEFGFDDEDATYFLGRETVLPSSESRFAHALDNLFAFTMRNATGAAAHFELPPEKVVEIGSHVEL